MESSKFFTKLPAGHKNPLEGIEMIEFYRDETTIVTANRQWNKADGEALQEFVAEFAPIINNRTTVSNNENKEAA